MNSDQTLDSAAEYAARGWPVVCLHGIKGGVCTCGDADCGSPGKHPRTRHGLKDATTDPEKVRRWWSRWPDSNVGITTGADSAFIAIDIDPRHGGAESFDELVREHGPLPPTVEALTGGGGCHLIFAHPGEKTGNRANVRPGIDVRGDGGYIVAAPSTHVSGGQYTWKEGCSPADLEPATAPEWLLALCARLEPAAAVASTPAEGAATDEEQHFLMTRASLYATKAKPAREGERNQRAFQLAGHLVAFETDESGLRLTKQQIIEIMRGWNIRNVPPLPDDELAAAVDSAIANGSPRRPHVVRPKAPKGRGASVDGESQADRLVELASDVELFRTPGGSESEGYATIQVGEGQSAHRENWAVGSKHFRRHLGRRYYQEYRKAPGAQALQDALNVLAGKAVFDGPEHAVAVRIAGKDKAIFLDLGDPDWRAVEITRAGWRVVTDPPVKFVRPRGMLALPEPVRGGSISELREFANVTDREWPLLLGWLVAALRPTGPYPILPINGEQGCAKSTLSRVLRALIDPNTAPLRAEPRDTRDLMIAASNGWVIALDNLSSISPWLSDAMCRLSTGGGFSTRELYSDGSEKLFDAMRPVLINGIEELTTRSDLLDRSIPLSLPSIPESQRQAEAVFWRRFEEAKPRVLGALLDAVVTGLGNVDSVQLSTLPRMADFAIWATACEAGLDLSPGTFVSAYDRSRDASVQLAIESSAVGPAVLGLMSSHRSWRGTAHELLTRLAVRHTDEATRKRQDWPKSPRSMASALRRLATDLRRLGVEVMFGERDPGRNRNRIIDIRRMWDRLSADSGSCSLPCGAPRDPGTGGKASTGPDDRRTVLDLDRPQQSQPADIASDLSDDADDADDLELVAVGGDDDWCGV